jgi:hypothetical protein
MVRTALALAAIAGLAILAWTVVQGFGSDDLGMTIDELVNTGKFQYSLMKVHSNPDEWIGESEFGNQITIRTVDSVVQRITMSTEICYDCPFERTEAMLDFLEPFGHEAIQWFKSVGGTKGKTGWSHRTSINGLEYFTGTQWFDDAPEILLVVSTQRYEADSVMILEN